MKYTKASNKYHSSIYFYTSDSSVFLVMSNSVTPYSPLGSSIHGIFQARIREWFDISFSKGSSQPKDQT